MEMISFKHFQEILDVLKKGDYYETCKDNFNNNCYDNVSVFVPA